MSWRQVLSCNTWLCKSVVMQSTASSSLCFWVSAFSGPSPWPSPLPYPSPHTPPCINLQPIHPPISPLLSAHLHFHSHHPPLPPFHLLPSIPSPPSTSFPRLHPPPLTLPSHLQTPHHPPTSPVSLLDLISFPSPSTSPCKLHPLPPFQSVSRASASHSAPYGSREQGKVGSHLQLRQLPQTQFLRWFLFSADLVWERSRSWPIVCATEQTRQDGEEWSNSREPQEVQKTWRVFMKMNGHHSS